MAVLGRDIMKFEFVEEKERHVAKIKVVGVGGAGVNAINNMITSKLIGVDFVVANTDCQDLDRSMCSRKIQLGPTITMGLGAGADPEIGRSSAEESINGIREAVYGPDMIFLTAGMGGGTGTGAAPIVAKACKESGALTVAVVTKPFGFEGEKRMRRAMEGIEGLRKEVDSLIVIPNDRLKSLASNGSSFKDLMARADEVLLQAVKGISDLIMSNGFINLDFADIKKVMEEMGTAIMGTGRASGENRATEAAQLAINSPLLEDLSIIGARGLLMNITAPSTITMDEVDGASNYIKKEVNEDAEIFWGVVLNDSLKEDVQVTVIATGLDKNGNGSIDRVSQAYSNVVKIREVTPEEAIEDWTVNINGESLDKRPFQREYTPPLSSVKEGRYKVGKKGILSKLGLKDSLDYPTFFRAKAD